MSQIWITFHRICLLTHCVSQPTCLHLRINPHRHLFRASASHCGPISVLTTQLPQGLKNQFWLLIHFWPLGYWPTFYVSKLFKRLITALTPSYSTLMTSSLPFFTLIPLESNTRRRDNPYSILIWVDSNPGRRDNTSFILIWVDSDTRRRDDPASILVGLEIGNPSPDPCCSQTHWVMSLAFTSSGLKITYIGTRMIWFKLTAPCSGSWGELSLLSIGLLESGYVFLETSSSSYLLSIVLVVMFLRLYALTLISWRVPAAMW